MPLSTPTAREALHTRDVVCVGYKRGDGLYDVEGHLVDTKSYSFSNKARGEIKPGEPLHEMWIRLTLDEHMHIHDVEAVTDAGPFEICPDIVDRFKLLIGLSIGPGWTRKAQERLGGANGCTHLLELLRPVATTAYQTLYSARKQRGNGEPAGAKKPAFIDTCHALASDSVVVKEHWPRFYTGPE